MKSYLFLIVAFACECCHAQSSVFLAASAGPGVTNTHITAHGGTFHFNNVATYDLRLNVGIEKKHLLLIAGVEYLETGYEQPLAFSFDPATGLPMGHARFITKFQHVIVPLCAGWKFLVSSNLSISPIVGVKASYNLWETENLSDAGHPPLKSRSFDTSLNRVSLFVSAQLNLEYKLNSHFSVIATPSYCYMATNLLKVPGGAPYKATQNNYAALFDFGFKYNLTKKKPVVASQTSH